MIALSFRRQQEFGLKALPTERGKVKPVDCPTVDEPTSYPKKPWQEEAGKERRYQSPKLMPLGVSSSPKK